MTRSLKVTALKGGEPYLDGTFDVADADYDVVARLLEEITLERSGAEDLLIGYMHAEKMGQVSEEIGKMAMVATVSILKAGENDIVISLSDGAPSGEIPTNL